VLKDVLRKARRAGVPLGLPPSHPFNPLVGLHATSLPLADDARRALTGALFAALWETGEGIEAPGAVARIAGRLGLDGAAIEQTAGEPMPRPGCARRPTTRWPPGCSACRPSRASACAATSRSSGW
jgi:2-hydroxychromene-2-carboxylate isomerase